MITGPMRNSLSRTLLANGAFDIEFNGYLSNHAKHAIIALDRLDASSNRVEEYWKEYTTLTPYRLQLHKVDQDWENVKPATLQDWMDWRGNKVHWQEQVAFMNRELRESFDGDTDRLVKRYAPDLLPGLTGALTHGIIHLGWAVDAASPWMITEGLAYLNFCYLGVDASKLIPDQFAELSPMESFLRISKTFEDEKLKQEWVDKAKASYDERFHPELVPAGFQWELSKVLKDSHPVATHLPMWVSKMSLEELWEDLYRATVYMYLATRDQCGNGNFVVLHLITSLWGLEHVCRVIDDEKVTRRAVSHYYASLVTLLSVAGNGFPPNEVLERIQKEFPPNKEDASDLDWSATVQRGIAEEEEHNIKLVYVARELWRRYSHWNGFSEAAQSFTLTPNIGPGATAFGAEE